MTRLTDRGIQALKPQAERYEVWEQNGKGFGVRVSTKGRKSFVFLYRFQGKARRMTFGAYPLVGLAQARIKHAHALEKLEKGIDPGAEEQSSKQKDRASWTVKDLADYYLREHAEKKKRSAAEDKRILNKDVLPRWEKRKAKDISRSDVVDLVDEIAGRGAPIMARRTYSVLRKMYRFGIRKAKVDTTPCVEIDLPGKEARRDRILAADEIRTFWKGLDASGMDAPTRLALRLMLVTAQRKGEVVPAQWTEFDLDGHWWTIPASRAKNGQAHRVPLSPLALKILGDIKALRKEDEKSDWLFPSPADEGPMTDRALNRAIDRSLGEWGIAKFTPHDLRRTAASHMASVGVSRLVISKVLNHADTGVTAIYDRHSYDSEKRAALTMWGARLTALIPVAL